MLIKEELDFFKDKRGFVFDPLTPEDIANQKNMHVVITLPGFIRGNHFHKKSYERLVVYGSSLIRVKEKNIIKDINVSSDQIVRLTIAPGISHAIKNTGNDKNQYK